ncbi:MAG: ankyrin repeat domain-containing protein, partial [Calditrichaceae bacterium]|nr:ankyrin repeat domain-containing protein [Calditrichaceae bacterium]
TVIMLSHHLLLAQDDFNDFAACIYKKDINGVKDLLAKGVDINIREKTMGSTPLIVACSLEGTDAIIELLISKGADVNIIGTYDGRTALMWAAANSKKAVELLLKNGAKVNVKGVDGMTAFIQSIFGILSGSVTTDVCDLLIENGEDVNAQLTGADATGWSALMFAASNGKPDLIKYLISKKADVNLKAKDGATALSLAVKDKNEEMVKVLKTAGAE